MDHRIKSKATRVDVRNKSRYLTWNMSVCVCALTYGKEPISVKSTGIRNLTQPGHPDYREQKETEKKRGG